MLAVRLEPATLDLESSTLPLSHLTPHIDFYGKFNWSKRIKYIKNNEELMYSSI